MKPTALAASACAALALGAGAAQAAPTVTEFTGGTTPGFTASSAPFGITGGPDNAVWFTQTASPGRVGRIALDAGTPAFTELTGGSTAGFSADGFPYGIGVGPDSAIWFAQSADPGRVARVNSAGVTEYTGGATQGFTANGRPQYVGKGPDHLWFTQSANPGRVSRITATGAVTQFTGGLTPGFSANGNPLQIVSDADGNMWFTQSANPGRVGKITPQGTFTELTGGVTRGFSANGSPYGITADAVGNVWFTQSAPPGRVARIAPGGEVTEYTGGVTPGFTANAGPTSITVGPDGNVWFLETASPGRVAQITPGGGVTEYAAGATPGFTPDAALGEITAGPDGSLWFTESAPPGRVARMSVGPLAQTGPPRAVKTRTATLTGTTRSNGQQTSYRFEYGRTTRYGSRTPDQVIDAGNALRPVSADLTRLRPNTRYHFRLVAVSDGGTATGADRTFRTPQVVPLASLRLSRTSFRAGGVATIAFRLRVRSRVRLAVQRPGAGRFFDGQCFPPFRFRRGRRCTRWVDMAGSRRGLFGAGTKRVRFTGRFGGRRAGPGRFRLVATASSGGRTVRRSVRFRVLP